MTGKPFKNFEDQIKILKSRGLIISDDQTAEEYLRRYGYYEVINGYKNHFMKSDDDVTGFKDGVTFEHLLELYRLDRNLSFSVIEALERFEMALRQAVAYVISKNISDQQNIYVNRRHYSTGRRYYNRKVHRNIYPIDETIHLFKNIIDSPKQPIKHYRENHGNVPPWILVKELSFGSLIWVFELLKKREKEEVLSSMFGWDIQLVELLSNSEHLKKYMHELLLLYLSFRNTASHGGRIYNHRSDNHALSFNEFFHTKFLQTDSRDYRLGKGKSDYGTILLSLKMFQPRDSYGVLLVNSGYFLKDYLEKYPDDEQYLFDSMNLDWEKLEYPK